MKTFIKLIITGLWISLPTTLIQGTNSLDLQAKITQLEQQVKDCLNKKMKLLQQCDLRDSFNKITHLHNRTTKPQSSYFTRREIAIFEPLIAQHTRQLLDTMSPEKKVALQKLLREHDLLQKELCTLQPLLKNQEQPSAFQVYFI